MFREASPGYRRSSEQRTADGSLPSAGQLHTCPAAQPQPQNEPSGMMDAHITQFTSGGHTVTVVTRLVVGSYFKIQYSVFVDFTLGFDQGHVW